MTTFTREDYEMAAKAVGFIDDQTSDDEDSLGLRRNGQGIFYVVGKRGWHNWKPPEDDGDALRLAVKLNLIVGTYDTYASVCHTMILGGESDTPDEEVVWFHSTGGDQLSATRHAIFRAAIAIGRGMP